MTSYTPYAQHCRDALHLCEGCDEAQPCMLYRNHGEPGELYDPYYHGMCDWIADAELLCDDCAAADYLTEV